MNGIHRIGIAGIIRKKAKKDDEIRNYITKYLEWGFNIVPGREHTKYPVEDWRKYQSEKYPREKLKEYVDMGKRNWMVICGAISHNLVVLDFDDPQLYKKYTERIERRFMDTFIVRTGKKGYHIYYRTPEPVKSTKLGKIDILGEGKLAMLPPSVHPENNGIYIIWEDREPLKLKNEEWQHIFHVLMDITGADSKVKNTSKTEGEIAKIIQIVGPYWKKGQRDALEYALLGYMRKKGVPMEIASKVLRGLITLTGDEEASMRLKNLERNYELPVDELKGYSQLKDILSKEDLKKVEKYVMALSPNPKLEEKKNEKNKGKMKKVVSYIALPDKLYLAVKGDNDNYYFAYLDEGEVKLTKVIELEDAIYEPRNPYGDPVYYPTTNIMNAKYVETNELIKNIEEHLKKYIDLEDRDLEFSIYYILFTWFYRKVHTVPYLAFRGDTGKGKTRMLDVIGQLCFYPLITSGGSSRSAIMRAQEDYKGTLVLDESDFRGDKEHEMAKYINSGFEDYKPFLLTNRNSGKRERYDNFCPKILGMREAFQDAASEGRIFTISPLETMRTDIPPNLNDIYFQETDLLRDLIARWALENWSKINGEYMEIIQQLPLEGRIKQLGAPLTILIPILGEDYAKKLIYWLLRRQKEIAKDRANSTEGIIFNAVVDISQRILEDRVDVGDSIDYYGEEKFITTSMVIEETGLSKNTVKRKLQEIGFETLRKKVKIGDKRTTATLIYISSTRRWVENWRRYRWGEELIDVPPFLKLPNREYKNIDKYRELLNTMKNFSIKDVSTIPVGSTIGHREKNENETLKSILSYFNSNFRVHACVETVEPVETGNPPLVGNSLVYGRAREDFKVALPDGDASLKKGRVYIFEKRVADILKKNNLISICNNIHPSLWRVNNLPKKFRPPFHSVSQNKSYGDSSSTIAET